MRRVLWVLAALCAALGIVFAAVPGLRFGALLFFCASAFCGATVLLSALR